ncbi:MAG: hypothetical protein HYZ91_07200 [Candidatus Omnitrophica bacterium]|nr:hypothetical protein [Candidatus Omnitrophota bacterium]
MSRVVVVLVALIGCVGVVQEAGAFSFSVEPSRVELAIPAGKSRGKTIRVNNSRTDKPLHLKLYIQDVMFLPDGTSDFPPPGSTAWSCANWIKVIPEELDIAPGSSQEVRISATVPAGAQGGYYAMVFFETGPSYAEEGLGVSFRIGALTQVTVPNTEVYQAKLADLSIADPAQISADLFNEGNVLIRPKGKAKVFDAQGKRVAQIEFNPDRLGVLPKTLRKFQVGLGSSLPSGSYRVKLEIDYGAPYLLVGERAFQVP